MPLENKVIDGANVLLKVDDKYVALATDSTLNIAVDMQEVKYKKADRSTSRFRQVEAGVISWTVSQNAYFAADNNATLACYRSLMAKAIDPDPAANEVAVEIEYRDGAAGDTIFKITGNARVGGLDLNNANSGEKVTFSATLEGNGAIAQTEEAAV